MDGDKEFEIEKKFKKYSEKVKECENVDNENKLFLYSHYKQSLFGDNNTEKPSIFDRVGIEKWKAWSNLKGMSKGEAMKNYIKKVKEIYKKE